MPFEIHRHRFQSLSRSLSYSAVLQKGGRLTKRRRVLFSFSLLIASSIAPSTPSVKGVKNSTIVSLGGQHNTCTGQRHKGSAYRCIMRILHPTPSQIFVSIDIASSEGRQLRTLQEAGSWKGIQTSLFRRVNVSLAMEN